MKKTMGIFMAVCFLLSVTFAAVGAAEPNVGNKDPAKTLHHHGDKVWKHNKLWMWVWIPGHYEAKVISKVIYRHHHRIVIKKVIRIWIPGHWELKFLGFKPGFPRR